MNRLDRKKLIKNLDQVFSKYIRTRDGHCLWCGTTSSLQCAHIIGRANFRFRWEPSNAIALCYACHIYKWHKSPLEAAEWLQQKHPFYYQQWQAHRAETSIAKTDLLVVKEMLYNLERLHNLKEPSIDL